MSGLFEEQFIHQVQVVAYFHEWDDAAARGGNFYHFAQNGAPPGVVLAAPRAGSAIDGSKVIHAADVYLPDGESAPPARANSAHRRAAPPPPAIDKSSVNRLVRLAGPEPRRWAVQSDNATVATYGTDDLRLTVVYRARCFGSAADARCLTRPRRSLWAR